MERGVERYKMKRQNSISTVLHLVVVVTLVLAPAFPAEAAPTLRPSRSFPVPVSPSDLSPAKLNTLSSSTKASPGERRPNS